MSKKGWANQSEFWTAPKHEQSIKHSFTVLIDAQNNIRIRGGFEIWRACFY